MTCRLEVLDVSHNYITNVPRALATAPALSHLDLGYNSNSARQACLTLDAEGLAVLTAMPSLRVCALARYACMVWSVPTAGVLFRYDESDMEEKLAEEFYQPLSNHEVAALLQLSGVLAGRGGSVEVFQRSAAHCGCSVCGQIGGDARDALAWF